MMRCPLVVGLCLVLLACQTSGSPDGGASSARAPAPAKLLTDAEEDGIRDQIQANWNIPHLDACPPDKVAPFEMRIWVNSDGTVTMSEPVASGELDACTRAFYDSAHRAVLISSPLKLPQGRSFKTMRLRFHPNEVIE